MPIIPIRESGDFVVSPAPGLGAAIGDTEWNSLNDAARNHLSRGTKIWSMQGSQVGGGGVPAWGFGEGYPFVAYKRETFVAGIVPTGATHYSLMVRLRIEPLILGVVGTLTLTQPLFEIYLRHKGGEQLIFSETAATIGTINTVNRYFSGELNSIFKPSLAGIAGDAMGGLQNRAYLRLVADPTNGDADLEGLGASGLTGSGNFFIGFFSVSVALWSEFDKCY